MDVPVDGDSPVRDIITRRERHADATTSTNPDSLRVQRVALNGGHHGTRLPDRVGVGDVEAPRHCTDACR